jgi:uncharacterized coiled-coil DUF342 family protein
MAEHEDDLRAFIRWHTARSDRVLREVLAEWKRDRGELVAEYRELVAEYRELSARSQRVIERNSRVVDEVIVELRDQRGERRALIDAVMRLIDRIDPMNPGGAAA